LTVSSITGGTGIDYLILLLLKVRSIKVAPEVDADNRVVTS
jgi:hypothetical protein